ncbi:MAG: hypothetical protein AAF999_06235 [Pseudomonadota bacterium]
MAREPRPVFLERRNYRRRRMTDAMRLVAVLGVLLWLIPIIWPNGQDGTTDAMPMSAALYYIFGVWLVLIGLAAVLTSMLGASAAQGPDAETTPERDP